MCGSWVVVNARLSRGCGASTLCAAAAPPAKPLPGSAPALSLAISPQRPRRRRRLDLQRLPAHATRRLPKCVRNAHCDNMVWLRLLEVGWPRTPAPSFSPINCCLVQVWATTRMSSHC